VHNNGEIEKIKKTIRSRLERYIQRSGLRLNPDAEHVEEIMTGLAFRKQKFGRAYCPCRLPTGNSKEDGKITCPCRWHRDEIESDGMCLCKLFFAPVKATSGGNQ
jgi:ferredoxin-thioredoxin reductase catalytic chain